MKEKILLTLGVACLTWALTGCVNTIDGKHKAGWPLLSDTWEARYERPMDQVWKAAKDTLTYNGVVTVENIARWQLEAKVDTRTVWLVVEALNSRPPHLTRVLIQVRTKGGGSDKPLAAELDKQIAIRLASGNLMPATPPTRPTPPAPTR